MYSFGKTPPRSLKTFGVAGLLAEDCRVFYSNLFTTRHVGRISDLLAAQLGPMRLDELKLRALLLFTFFEAYRAQGNEGGGPLAEPLTVECGTDSEKIAIGISFAVQEAGEFEPEALAERLADGAPKSPFEALLKHVHSHADCLVIRWQPVLARAEVVALLAIPEKMEVAAGPAPIEVVQLEGEIDSEKLKTLAYIELGDLDYPKLLVEDKPGESLDAPATGEILAKQSDELEEAIRIRSQEKASTEIIRIAGTKEKANDEVIRITGEAGQETDDTEIRISSDNALVKSYEDKIKALEEKIIQLQLNRGSQSEEAQDTIIIKSSPGAGGEEDSEESGAALGGIFKKVWPFKKKDTEGEVEEESAEEESSEEETVEAVEAAVAEEEVPRPTPLPEETVESSENSVKTLISEIETGNLQKTISKAQQEVLEIKKELTNNPRTKRFVDGLMSELVAEKARLGEYAKKLNQNVRQKELEMRNREQALKEELRKAEESLRQKNSALTRTKEQLTSANMTLERMKSSAHGAADDAHFKHKFESTKKMLTVAREENGQLTRKVEDLKEQLAVAQLAATKKSKGNAPEFTQLQAQCERLQKQVEEFKKANVQLMDKLTKSKKDGAVAANVEEMKKRLEAALKLANANKKETDQMQLRIEELEREEMRLKMEVQKAYAQLKRTKGAA